MSTISRTGSSDLNSLNSPNSSNSSNSPWDPNEYLKLFRLQTGATTAIAPVIGYLVMGIQIGYNIKVAEMVLIFFIGILMHIFEFVLNEYIDVDVDRRAPDLVKKPLVAGTISMTTALVIVFGAILLSFIFTFLFFLNIWTVLFLTLSFVFGAIYDIHGKRFVGSDFTLALWIFFFCLFGASIISIQFTGELYLIAGLGFFQILFNNAVEGGIKDADHDALAGAKTLANALGVRVKKGKLVLPGTFKLASYAIKLGFISLIIILVYVSIIKIRSFLDNFLLLTIILLIFIIFYTLHKFLNIIEFHRGRLKRIFSIHEIATFYLTPILLLQLLGFEIVLFLLILPLAWYMALNVILYGRLLEPQV